MMDVSINVSREFERQAKRLAKKYRTFVDDFAGFLSSIKENPYQGVDLGSGKRKIRMAVTAKGKGKSGGMRVITFYDKQEISNVSDKYINQLIQNLK